MTQYPTDPLEAVAMSFILQSSDVSHEAQQAALAVLCARLKQEITAEQAIEQCASILGTSQPAKRINDIIDTPAEPIAYRHTPAESFSVRSARHKARNWSAYEDQRLFAGVRKFGLDNWTVVADFVGNGRTRSQCSQRWFRGLNPALFKGPWTEEEEEKLANLVQEFGEKSWKRIAALFGNRSDVQCRYHFQQMQKHRSRAVTKREEKPLVAVTTNDIESIPYGRNATVDQIFDMKLEDGLWSTDFCTDTANEPCFSFTGMGLDGF